MFPGFKLCARLFSVQICGESLTQVLLNCVLYGRVVLVGIQKSDRVCAGAHVATIRELEQIILERLIRVSKHR